MTKNPDWNRGKVFKYLGAPLATKYEWDAWAGNGMLFLQVSHRDVHTLASICLIDPDSVTVDYDYRSTAVRNKLRRERLESIRQRVPLRAYLIFSRTEIDHKTGRERTIDITPHQIHEVLSLDVRADGSIWCSASEDLYDPDSRAPVICPRKGGPFLLMNRNPK